MSHSNGKVTCRVCLSELTAVTTQHLKSKNCSEYLGENKKFRGKRLTQRDYFELFPDEKPEKPSRKRQNRTQSFFSRLKLPEVVEIDAAISALQQQQVDILTELERLQRLRESVSLYNSEIQKAVNETAAAIAKPAPPEDCRPFKPTQAQSQTQEVELPQDFGVGEKLDAKAILCHLEEGSCSPNAIARALSMNATICKGLCKKLFDAGFIARYGDAHRPDYYLTGKGLLVKT